jgi:DNA polymerase type B, organellar and viral
MTHGLANSSARRWHILQPTIGDSVPARILVFQIEPTVRMVDSSTHEHTFRLGCGVCYWLVDGQVVDQETRIFRRREAWFQWVSERSDRQRTTWLYSYGLVYSLTLLNWFHSLGSCGESLISVVLADPPSIVLTRQGRRVRKYVDVANYCRDGLRSLMRKSHARMPDVFSGSRSDAEATEYCKAKTLAVGDYLCQAIYLVRQNRLCGWQPTAASLSFATYRHSFLKSLLYLHSHEDATKLEREALFGGRVQTWRSGSVKELVTVVDCNSLYPHVMKDYPHPVKFRNHQWEGTVRELRQAVRGYWCAACVTLQPGSLDLPNRVDRSVTWGRSGGVYYLAGAELCQAVALDRVCRLHALARYDLDFPFSSFVDSLFGLKLSLTNGGHHAQATFIKTILNSLHGKFAQCGRRWVRSPSPVGGRPWTTWWGRHPDGNSWVPYRNLGGCCEYLEAAGEWRHSFPGLSASIASAARVELAKARDVAGAAQTLYCDTDSLHLIGDGHNRLSAAGLCDPTGLGQWKTVTTGADAYYWGLKHYRVGNKYCCCYLTPSAWEVADGRYRDAARLHFGHLLQEGLPDAVYYRERLVRIRDTASAERMELVDYEEVA